MTCREQLLEEALLHIARWADAYPPSVFPEPNTDYLRRAAEVLSANNMTLDRLSAHAIRHAVHSIGKIAKKALGDAAALVACEAIDTPHPFTLTKETPQ